MLYKLPEIDILSPAFQASAIGLNACSCSPDVVRGVRITCACLRHDLDYDLVNTWRKSREISFFRWMVLKRDADDRLLDGIIQLGDQAGVDLSDVALVYFGAVRRFNWLYRLGGWIAGLFSGSKN